MTLSEPKLFQPIQVGDMALAHRIVLAPLTRYRADHRSVHIDRGVEYYAQRASTPGTLLITEATFPTPWAGGQIPNMPIIYTDEQIAGWKRVVDAVHAKGSFIYLQLWGLGRAAVKAHLDKHGYPYVSSSDVPLKGREGIPRPLTKEEIKQYVQDFATAASNAVHKAGFDGIEIHGANGYLIDQFNQDTANKRTDEYGGSVENRARFALEVVDAVAKAIGVRKTAIRLSPWSYFQEMRMADPVPTFSYIVNRLIESYPDLAYLHLVEPGISGAEDASFLKEESNDFIRKLWLPRPLITAGGYTRESALKLAQETGEIIAFGRAYISNPDLPVRLFQNIPLTPWDRKTFYTPELEEGYIDYPFATAK